MLRVASHRYRPAVAHRDQHRAGIRAVMRARAVNGNRRLRIHGGSHEISLLAAVTCINYAVFTPMRYRANVEVTGMSIVFCGAQVAIYRTR